MAVLKDLNVSQIVLGIETSCDETAVACVHSDRTILAQTIHSQLDEHAAFGGRGAGKLQRGRTCNGCGPCWKRPWPMPQFGPRG